MPDLGDELRATIEHAATPITLDELRDRDTGRATRHRRALWRTFVAGVAVAALVIVGAVVVVNLGDDESPHVTRIAVPTVVVGDIDLAVLSTSFDGDGARSDLGERGRHRAVGCRRRRRRRRARCDAALRRRRAH
jgi:anti-sigma-K factor RskA